MFFLFLYGSGILSTEGEIARLNEILVPLVKQGQGIQNLKVAFKM